MLNKHLSFDERLTIEKLLNERKSFKFISNEVGKNCTTISREIRNHYVVKNIGAICRHFNNCLYRRTCPNRGKNCNINSCTNFVEEKCSNLDKPPYVCNGCKNRNSCTLTKHLYESEYAQTEYTDNLHESRSGIVIDQDDINILNKILTKPIKNQGQSIHHVLINNKNKIMFSESKIYKIVDSGLLDIRNIDLPRKVRFRQRHKNSKIYKIDKNCLVGRTYEDFVNYISETPDTPIVEMDTVEGRKGGKVLLTIHFVSISFMMAFIRDNNDAQSVIDIFNHIQTTLGIEKFKELFDIILTDNGSEFSNPTEIEFDMETGEQRTKIFYCHPSSPNEKGSCEVNHELLRRILPKGTSFDNLTQDDITMVMSHINSYKRKKLNNASPIALFSTIYGDEAIDKLGIKQIEPNDVNLSTTLLKK